MMVEKGKILLIALDLFYPEIGNILWKNQRSKELTASGVFKILDEILSLPIKIEPSKPLLQLAIDFGTA